MIGDPKPGRQRRKPYSRQGRDRRDVIWTAARDEFRRRGVRFGCQVCRVTGDACDGDVHAHHVVYEQHLRLWLAAHRHQHPDLANLAYQQLEADIIWAADNALGVCERAHRRHHNRIQPIPLDAIPFAAIEFAIRLGLAHRLEEAYPSAPTIPS